LQERQTGWNAGRKGRLEEAGGQAGRLAVWHGEADRSRPDGRMTDKLKIERQQKDRQ
jgi:hypothetical protein